MHPSITEQIASMHDRELLDRSRHHSRLPVRHSRAKTVRDLLRAVWRGMLAMPRLSTYRRRTEKRIRARNITLR